jgi:anti-anti-sigma factor
VLAGAFEVVADGAGGDATRLLLRGELDLATVEKLRTALEEELARSRHLVLDLSELVFIDSSGLRELYRATTASRRDGWRLELVGTQGDVLQTIRMSGMDQVLPLADA